MQRPAGERLACAECDLTFIRKEHLRRHMQRHSGVKPHECHCCSRRFSRRDALIRHMSLHGFEAAKSVRSRTGLVNPRPRACTNCAQARQRCQGTTPCTRCSRRGISCQYPAPRFSIARSQASPPSATDGATSEQLQNCSANLRREYDHISEKTGMDAPTMPPILPPMTTAAETLSNEELPDLHGLTPIPSPCVVMGPSQSAESQQTFGGEDQTIENQASGSNDVEWRHLLSSGLDAGESQPAQVDLLSTFMLGNFDFWGTNMTDDMPLQQNLQSSAQSDLISSDQPQVRERRGLSHAPVPVVLPSLSFEDQQMLRAEHFGHFGGVSPGPLRRLMCWYSGAIRAPQDFVTREVFEAFVELYYEHFADHFDFLHPSALEGDSASWILLLAVAAIGSQYSAVGQASEYALALQELLYRAVEEHFPPSQAPSDIILWAQIMLLRDICLVFGGGKQRQLKHLYGKNTLSTLCRLISLSASEQVKTLTPARHAESRNEAWRHWIDLETRNRLFHAVYYFECLQFLFLRTRPSVDLAEWSTSLPVKASLWKCRNAHEWAHVTRLQQDSMPNSEPSGISAAFIPSTEDEYLARLRFTYICVEEKLALGRLLEWPLRQFLPQVTARQRQRPTSKQTGENTNLYQQVVAYVENKLQSLHPQAPDETSELSFLVTKDVTFPLFTMLRYVQLQTLHAFSRWQASEDQVQAAHKELKTWLQDQPVLSRRCLFNAVIIFSSLRRKFYYACHDPLALLVAALFIWAYDQLVTPSNLPNVTLESPKVLRLDQISNVTLIRDWIHHGGAVQLHITGVGMLDGAASPSRTLQEFKRILSSCKGWSTMCSALADLAEEVIQGRQPVLT